MDNHAPGRFEKIVGRVSDLLMYAGAVLMLAMLFLGIADVMGRYLFNRPIIGTVEIFEVLMPGMVLLSLAYTQKVKAHVTVDLFVSKLPHGPRVAVGLVVTCWALVLFMIVAWQGTRLVFLYHQTGRVLTNLGLPMFLPRILVPLGAVAICLVFMVDLLHFVRELNKKG